MWWRRLTKNARSALKNLAHLARPGLDETLEHKRAYHHRRAIEERRLIVQARTDRSLLCTNRCPVCGGDRAVRRFSNPVGFEFAVCLEDGTIYMDPVPTDATLERLYNGQAYAFNWTGRKRAARPGDSGELKVLMRLLDVPPSSKSRLLDVGCASGGFLLAAREHFIGEGVELNEETAQLARSHGIAVYSGRLEELPVDEPYDVLTMRQLLEHVTAPLELLRAARRLLRPGGHIYISTPNIDSASFAYLDRLHTHVSSFGHVSLFNKASLEALARKAGFDVAAHEYYGGLDLALHDVVSLRFAPTRFRHRVSLYNSRLYYLSNVVENLTFGLLDPFIYPRGNGSYQRVLLKKQENRG
jgi:2-polyprenyl-3-methyl-5-hydroxy-6-metoxy-1,4-benzoquinol methylase